MPKIKVTMHFDYDGFEDASIEEQFEAIEDVLNTGAAASNVEIQIHEIEIKNKK